MGETVKLNDAIRMIWRDAARFIAQAMREEVSESGNKNVEEWALEVETFADGLIPLFDGRAFRDGWSWTDEKVLSTLKASGRLQTAILQGMGALLLRPLKESIFTNTECLVACHSERSEESRTLCFVTRWVLHCALLHSE